MLESSVDGISGLGSMSWRARGVMIGCLFAMVTIKGLSRMAGNHTSIDSDLGRRWITFSNGILRVPFLSAFLTPSLSRWTALSRLFRPKGDETVVGWGLKPTTDVARHYANRHGLPYVALEDGFLRSYGTGDGFAPLSMVVDDLGIYYDSRSPSRLEALLNSSSDLLVDIESSVDAALDVIGQARLSKYNHAPLIPIEALSALPNNDAMKRAGRVMVVDQTIGDMSVVCSQANAQTFQAMLRAARQENPQALIYVKTHPEVSAGRKAGYLTDVQDDERTIVVRQKANPASLFAQMDRVYVVSSTLGFEALLAGCAVTCFGVPWYAGWGVTDDRQACTRRHQRRSVRELFAAAYIHYSRYLDPVTRQRGQIADATAWLAQQMAMADQVHGAGRRGRVFAVDFARWKAFNLKPMLGLESEHVHFVSLAQVLAGSGGLEVAAGLVEPAGSVQLAADDTLLWWGAFVPEALQARASQAGARLQRVEDGFVRSVGLGSDMIRPQSLVFDSRGMYFDPRQPSDLEHLLNTAVFDAHELRRAAQARAFVVRHGLTKYNMEPRASLDWPRDGRPVLLVPGQVEDDASIRLGCTTIRTNLGLLAAVRADAPGALIVYKPHPDVLSGNRLGRLHLKQALRLADVVQTDASVIDCIEACDEVHTMTSLTGFDALLRGKIVVTYGQPFYAGWGLTVDRCDAAVAFARRQRRLSLDALVAGVLLRYPVYWDWTLRGYTRCEAVLHRLREERTALMRSGQLSHLNHGVVRRLVRKTKVLIQAWCTKW